MSQMSSLMDIQTIRQCATQRVAQGAVTVGYRADRQAIVELLNGALATETVNALRCRRHGFMAAGRHSISVSEVFRRGSDLALRHADEFAQRIVQLGGAPDFSPDTLASRSHSEYTQGRTVWEMIEMDLVSARVAVESYREIIDYIEDGDPTSRRAMEAALAAQEQYADEMARLLHRFPGDTAQQ